MGEITGTIPSKGVVTYTPGTINQTITSGQYLSGTQTILGDADLVGFNILNGKNIFGYINIFFTWETPLWKQQLIATCIVTTLEFIFGVVLNLWLKLNIWDYSGLSFNLLGQVSLLYSVLWFFLSLVAIILDDWLRFKWFGEEFKGYKIF